MLRSAVWRVGFRDPMTFGSGRARSRMFYFILSVLSTKGVFPLRTQLLTCFIGELQVLAIPRILRRGVFLYPPYPSRSLGYLHQPPRLCRSCRRSDPAHTADHQESNVALVRGIPGVSGGCVDYR